jgi:hypothetical protein
MNTFMAAKGPLALFGRDVQHTLSGGQSALCYRIRDGASVSIIQMPVGLAMHHAMGLRRAVRRGERTYRIKYWARDMNPHQIDLTSIRVIRKPYGNW